MSDLSESAERDRPRVIYDEPTRRLVTINWPALWCLVFFVVGFIAGRLW